MGFFSGLWSWISGSSISSNIAKTAMLAYASRLVSDSINGDSNTNTNSATPDSGARLQLSPSTTNKIPVLYGEAYFGGYITDAYLSTNYQKMTYVLTLCEKTGNKISGAASAYTFNGIYLNNNRVIFQADGLTVDYTLDSNGNQDISMRGLIKVYLYAGATGVQPVGYVGTTPASHTVVPNWTALNQPMTGLVYAVVEVTYNRANNITSIPDCIFHLTNSMSLPGDVLHDYILSSVYGANMTANDIDTSFTALNTFATTGFSYTDIGLVVRTGTISINGLIDTSQNVLSNMELIAAASSSWVSYDINQGKWTSIINKAGSTIATLTDSNIIGDISVSGTSLTQLGNVLDVQYPNTDILDKSDFVKIIIPNIDLYVNEPRVAIQLSLPLTNKQVVATKIGLQQLKQSRIDKIITFKTDYSYIGLKAGDIIGVTSAIYGYTNKAFRIISAGEEEISDGQINIRFTCLEYAASVYDYDITEYIIETDDGILGIGSIGKPDVPTVTKVQMSNIPHILIDAKVPSGIVDTMEYWFTTDVGIGNDSARTYTKIGTYSNNNGSLLTENSIVQYNYSQLSQSNFFVKVRGVNSQVSGPYSNPTGLIAYVPAVVANGLDANTGLMDGAGNILTALGLMSLLLKLDELFAGEGGKTLYDKVFDWFKDETGVDLRGNANNGSLVVEGNVGTKNSGTSITTTTSSYNFTGPLQATAAGNAVTISLASSNVTAVGTPELGDILSWNGTAWEVSKQCCDTSFATTCPDPSPSSLSCKLSILASYPPDRSTMQDSTIDASSDRAPITGSYYITFANGSYSSGFAAAITKGVGDAKLYKSDGTLIDTKSITACTVHNDTLEIPFISRALKTDYYVTMPEGFVTYCDCISMEITKPKFTTSTLDKGYIRDSTAWNFNTPAWAVTPYSMSGSSLVTPPVRAVTMLSSVDIVRFNYANSTPSIDCTGKVIETETTDDDIVWIDDIVAWIPTNPVVKFDSSFDKNSGNKRTRKWTYTYAHAYNNCPHIYLMLPYNEAIRTGNQTVNINRVVDDTTAATLASSSGVVLEQYPDKLFIPAAALAGLPLNETFYVQAGTNTVKSDVVKDCHHNSPSSATIGKLATFTSAGSLILLEKITSSLPVASDATHVQVNPQTEIKLKFNKAITFGTYGYINLYKDGDVLHQTFDVSKVWSDEYINELMSISGDTLIINPTVDMDLNTYYYILADATVILSNEGCGLGWGGFNTNTGFRFKTDNGSLILSTTISTSGSINDEVTQ